MKRRDQILFVAFAVSALGYFPFSQWMATTPVGTSWFLDGQLIYVLLLVASVLSLPVLAVCLFFRRTRQQSLAYLMLALLFIPCCIGGIALGQTARRAGMLAFAQRSQPLVNAIKKYEDDHSTPPASLDDLVPHYLDDVPSTGMMAYPEYRYFTGDDAREQYADNPWALSVFTPSGGINFDQILYFPKHNYPDTGYGGGLEPKGEWAYVHE